MTRRRLGCCAIAGVLAALLCVVASGALAFYLGLLPGVRAGRLDDVPALAPFTGVLFEDDFHSQQRSTALGWAYGQSQAVERVWAGNALNVTITKKNGGAACHINRLLKDFGAELEAQPEAEPGIQYGIVFRYSLNYGHASFYDFEITSDGKYDSCFEVTAQENRKRDGQFKQPGHRPPVAPQELSDWIAFCLFDLVETEFLDTPLDFRSRETIRPNCQRLEGLRKRNSLIICSVFWC